MSRVLAAGPVLHARYRQVRRTLVVPAVLAAAAGTALAVAVAGLPGPHISVIPSLELLTLVTMVAAGGLAGADTDLDRTAARPWPMLRAAQLAAVAGYALLLGCVPYLAVGDPVPVEVLVRDALGQTGAVALGVTVLGSTLGWIPPFLCCAPMAVTGGHGLPPAVTWLAEPADSTPALVISLLLGVGGTAAHLVLGPRDRR